MTLRERIKNEMMVIKALGVVYGDIGTSPIYTFAVILLLLDPTKQTIFEILSMILWTLTMLVTVQYAWLATSLSRRGEGGTVVLVQLLLPYLKGARLTALVTALGYVGISLMIGDGVITPAISILSAVEGINLIPGYEETSRMTLLLIAALIAFALFMVQKKGVENVATAFGPIMVVWFFSLGIVGGYFILQNTEVLHALSPLYALSFIQEHPYISFVILADVLLCATGGEALYADMGHLGRLPILKGWLFASLALILCYYGQGAFLLSHPESVKSPFFEMFHVFAPSLYIPLVILAIFATVIASQAMISGIFSVLYQAMTTRIFPHFNVNYTSNELRSQIYVGSVNWFLFICVVLMLFDFQESAKLASAYGLSVSGAMSITGILISMIFLFKKEYFKMSIAIITGLMSIIFFLSSWLKIPHGGYWSLIIASIPLFIILLYTKGQKKLYKALIPVDKDEFLEEYSKRYRYANHVNGTALFFARQANAIPAYIAKTMFQNGIIYDYNIIVIIKTSHEPHGITSHLSPLGEALDLLIIQPGYMEQLDVEKLLIERHINERTIFYGDEEIISDNIFWKMYAMIKELSPSFVSFYNFPHEKLIGVARRAKI
ncbi:MAG: potassium transporter Kup [Sulfuricurvum sp. PD_MW2]|jgi:KUP system potassium uptake protein|uniref:KUP/HAK/KT family potassium transporter n=1 Tax=Sulfuricurvum sp. PD_MW2 TaxID=2027917 RepID=UPI000C0625B4|nr:KUP/HAK/KT family potassium transporter [Sulfuricurvum sp. PD_MW2]PHM18353.1 MAG: potassium transporter Kup [Sulfuricurvum sp. PD_MW2]